MFPKPNEQQRRCEADRISLNDSKISQPEWAVVPRDEVIEHQPRELYRPPLFLSRTATPAQVADLEESLRELWEINEQHVGENTREVEVYYCVTGEYRPLSERLRRWCQSYFERRADPSRLSPQVHNDPFELFQKLLEEYTNILGRLHTLRRSLGYFFLSLATAYVPWLLYKRLWKDLVLILDDCRILKYRPADPSTPRRMVHYVTRGGWEKDHLGLFLARLCEGADAARIREIGGASDADIGKYLASLAADIQEMRPFLVRGFNPRKAVVSFGPGLVAAWTWTAYAGIASVIGGRSQAQVEEAVESRRVSLAVRVSHEGLFIDANKPWLTVDTAQVVGGVSPLVLNCYALERFHEKLFSFYDRIDFERIRARARSRCLETDLDEEAIALSCQDLAATDPQAGRGELPGLPTGLCRVRAVRCQRLLTLLETRFGCEVRQGKGSEVTVYRQGGKKFTLGHHTPNPLVPSLVVGRLLKRLGVGLPEWLGVVFGP